MRALLDSASVETRSAADVNSNMSIRKNLHFRDGLTQTALVRKFEDAGLSFACELYPTPLYTRGMRAWPLTDRLRQSAENRFSLVFAK